MNLTRLIEVTGRRIRAGQPPSERLTNAQIKAVLETAVAVMKQALIQEGRLEIQGFAVIEIKTTPVKPSVLNGKVRKGERVRWTIRVSDNLKKTGDET